jgi:hypothetical protein
MFEKLLNYGTLLAGFTLGISLMRLVAISVIGLLEHGQDQEQQSTPSKPTRSQETKRERDIDWRAIGIAEGWDIISLLKSIRSNKK